MIVTADDEAAAFMRALRNQGRAPGDTWLQHTHLGYNYRMDETERRPRPRADEPPGGADRQRAAVADCYAAAPGRASPACRPRTSAPDTTRMSWFVYVVRFAPRDRPRRRGPGPGRARHPRPALLPAHPFAALHGRALRLPARRFPRHRRPGQPRPGPALLGRDVEAQVETVCQTLTEVS